MGDTRFRKYFFGGGGGAKILLLYSSDAQSSPRKDTAQRRWREASFCLESGRITPHHHPLPLSLSLSDYPAVWLRCSPYWLSGQQHHLRSLSVRHNRTRTEEHRGISLFLFLFLENKKNKNIQQKKRIELCIWISMKAITRLEYQNRFWTQTEKKI